MKLIGYIVLGLVIIGLVGAAAKVVVIAILIAILLAALANPRETFGFLAGLFVLGLIGHYPLPGLILLIVLGLFAIRDQGR